MPNHYAEERFKEGKLAALWALLNALWEEKLPQERGHYFKTGQIEKFFDRDTPLQPRTLLAVLRDAEVPHDNNWRFRPLAIYEHLPQLEGLHWHYHGDRRPKYVPAEQKTGPEVEETGKVEVETAQGDGEAKGDEAVAESRSGPSETWDKPEVEIVQSAEAGRNKQGPNSFRYEGVNSDGKVIYSAIVPGRLGLVYAVVEGINSEGTQIVRLIGSNRPRLVPRW